MSTFGAGRYGRSSNRGPHADRVSSASSARQATWMGTRFAECASTCAAFGRDLDSGPWRRRPRHAQDRKRLCHSDARGHRAVAVRASRAKRSKPAVVRYTQIEGTREAKLAALDAISDFASVKWQNCPAIGSPLPPRRQGQVFRLAAAHGPDALATFGCTVQRTWPIAPDLDTIERRWRGLLSAKDRSEAFHGSGDREIHGTYRVTLTAEPDSKPIAQLSKNAVMPQSFGTLTDRLTVRRLLPTDG